MLDVVKSALIEMATKQALLYLVKKLPFLSLPIINPIASYFLGKLIGVIVEHTALGINFLAIDYSLDKDVEKMEEAVKEARKAVQSNDEKLIEESSNKLIEASRDLIRIGRGIG